MIVMSTSFDKSESFCLPVINRKDIDLAHYILF